MENNISIQHQLLDKQTKIMTKINEHKGSLLKFKTEMAKAIKMKDEAFVKIRQLGYELKELQEKIEIDQKCNEKYQRTNRDNITNLTQQVKEQANSQKICSPPSRRSH